MLPESIVIRAEKHILEGMDVTKAIELAFDEENTMICSLLNSVGYLSDKGKKVADVIRKDIYNKFNTQSSCGLP
jgi:hypothetical protein